MCDFAAICFKLALPANMQCERVADTMFISHHQFIQVSAQS